MASVENELSLPCRLDHDSARVALASDLSVYEEMVTSSVTDGTRRSIRCARPVPSLRWVGREWESQLLYNDMCVVLCDTTCVRMTGVPPCGAARHHWQTLTTGGGGRRGG